MPKGRRSIVEKHKQIIGRVDIMSRSNVLKERTRFLACFVLVAGLVPAGAFAGDLTAAQILGKAYANRELDGSDGTVKLTLYDKQGGKWTQRGESRVIEVKTKLVKEKGDKIEKKLYRFVKPADVKGMAVLAWDYEKAEEQMWVYRPSNRQTIKLVSSDKSGNFMGSDFTYADMNAPILSNYTLKIEKSDADVGGTKCWQIKVIPNDKTKDEEGYSKKVIWIGKNDFMVRKSMFWDLDGDLLKVLMTRGIEKVKGTDKYYIGEMSMINKQEDTKSVFKTVKKVSDPKIADKHFASDKLSKP